MEIQIDYLSLFVAAIGAMIVGSLWHGPIFGKLWISLMGFTEEKLEELKNRGMKSMYALAFGAALLMAFVLAHFANVWNAVGVSGALALAFWAWLGFIVTTMINSVLWEGKSWKLYFFNIGHQLISLVVMALIIVLWP